MEASVCRNVDVRWPFNVILCSKKHPSAMQVGILPLILDGG